jgi:hypothetical protein
MEGKEIESAAPVGLRQLAGLGLAEVEREPRSFEKERRAALFFGRGVATARSATAPHAPSSSPGSGEAHFFVGVRKQHDGMPFSMTVLFFSWKKRGQLALLFGSPAAGRTALEARMAALR